MNALYCQYRCEREEEHLSVSRRAELLVEAADNPLITRSELYDLCKVALFAVAEVES